MTILALLWVCKNDAGTLSLILPSTISFTILAFSSPQTVMKISLAWKMVPMPIVMQQGGTCSPLAKLLVISSRERLSMRMRRETEDRPEPGSFAPMFPLRPMPKSAMSKPPNVLMRCS